MNDDDREELEAAVRELRRLRMLAQSLSAGIEELPGWAQLRVAAMVAPPVEHGDGSADG